MKNEMLSTAIRNASNRIGKTWPLYSFVTSNPLSGYETMDFRYAMTQAQNQLGNRVYPTGRIFSEAYFSGGIAPEILIPLLGEYGYFEAPDSYLQQMHTAEFNSKNSGNNLNQICTKWLSAFLDEGLAEWSMPAKNLGFYKAWRAIARYDRTLKGKITETIPETPLEAIERVLQDFPVKLYSQIIEEHLCALPGWSGYIKYRVEEQTPWQKKYPISLEDYLGVRLWLCHILNIPVWSDSVLKESDSTELLNFIWLTAWERTWQKNIIKRIKPDLEPKPLDQNSHEAQLVFCIDTRSERIRRHIESLGKYETFGYAGFFGIAMDYKDPENGMVRKSCPPIVPSSYLVHESPEDDKQLACMQFETQSANRKFFNYTLKRMKNMLPATFGFVEGTGLSYGMAILLRTFLPQAIYRLTERSKPKKESLFRPHLKSCNNSDVTNSEIPLTEKAAIVGSALKLMGWNHFAPLVVLVGHASHTANNPYGSSLDCGACAAGPGRNNARMLANLANDPDVRKLVKSNLDIQIPDTTYFIAAEHNTTTDEVSIFDAGLPQSHFKILNRLKMDLDTAKAKVAQERLGFGNRSADIAKRFAGDWSETRPEWGLAGNAGFIIGPRTLTRDKNLEGRCFLHSYKWDLDSDGTALENILQGPMVVTQWINSHYYFSTVDPNNFGGGSKITHNPIGQFGVVQGNGGDLKYGLSLQSLYTTDQENYHQPLRLSVLIQAPRTRITDILERNLNLKNLIANGWICMLNLEPEEANRCYRCTLELNWLPLNEQKVENPVYSKSEIEVSMY